MIGGADIPQPACIEDVWDRAWRFAEANEPVFADVQRAERLDSSQVTASDFLREYAWAVLGARRRYEVLARRWPAIEEAFCYWDVGRVVEESASVRAVALRALNSPRKVDGVLEVARWLDKGSWTTIRAEFLRLVTTDLQGNALVTGDLLKWLDQLPWVGRTLAAYIAKNLGVGGIKDDVWMLRLAGWLDYSANTAGVCRMASDMQIHSGQKINIIDTVLWNWARHQTWLPHAVTNEKL